MIVGTLDLLDAPSGEALYRIGRSKSLDGFSDTSFDESDTILVEPDTLQE